MRKRLSTSTLKKLFALSGNLCAFPSCASRIVDEKRSLIGRVCHIEAAEKGGERYNPNQTDEERADFANLILLCAIHHIVTNDVSAYSVEALRQMKLEHEKKYLEKPYSVPDDVVSQAADQIGGIEVATNYGSVQQINSMGGYININQTGITAADVVTIVEKLYDSNFPKLYKAAREVAEQNMEKFKEKLREEVSKVLNEKELGRFSDPDIQAGLYEAAATSARDGSEALRELLAKLVVKRVKNDDITLKQKVLNEAIRTIGKITPDQLNILTLCFLLKHASFTDLHSWEEFKIVLERDIKPFIEFKGTDTEILHLQYAGCGKVEEALNLDLAQTFRNNYSFLFLNEFDSGSITALTLPIEISNEIIVEGKQSGKIIFKAKNISELKKFLEEKGVKEPLLGEVVNLYNKGVLSPTEVQQKMESSMEWTKKLFYHFQETELTHLSLTSVGMAIAITHFEQVVANPLNIDIWIN